MESKDSQDLEAQQKRAEDALSKLPEPDRTVLQPALELQKQRNQLYLAFMDELRALEYTYDQKYEPIYSQRAELIKNTSEFWLKVLKNNPLVSTMIFEQDEQVLNHLTDIKVLTEPNSDNFTIEFHFSPNKFIENSVLTKKYIMDSNDNPEKAEGTEIKWKGANLTQKIKKTKTRGKNKKKGIKIEEIPSFFNFFKDLTADDDIEEEDDDDLAMTLEEDYDTACEIRDEIVPNAPYFYLGIRQNESDEEDDNEVPKPKKIDGSGTEKADCKPQ
jgi:nucleosome assembly protein 1-like 1